MSLAADVSITVVIYLTYLITKTVYPRIMARATIFSNKDFPQKFAATIRDCATNRVCAIIRCIIKNKLIIYF